MPVAAATYADQMLVAAFEAGSFEHKAHFATRGLSRERLPAETQWLLLRQLYLAALGAEHFAAAAQCAEQMLQLGKRRAAAHTDAARAYAALHATDGGSVDAFRSAVSHQRAAARLSPASLRAVQYGKLARLLRREKHWEQAGLALKRALRWSTSDRALLHAQYAVLKLESGEKVNVRAAYESLEQKFVAVPLSYYVAAQLAASVGPESIAKHLFSEFCTRWQVQPLVARVSLLAEQRDASGQAGGALVSSAPGSA